MEILSINICVTQGQGNGSASASGQSNGSGIGVFEALFESMLFKGDGSLPLGQEGNLEGELVLSLGKMAELGNNIEDETIRSEFLANIDNLMGEGNDLVIKNAEELEKLLSLMQSAGLKLENAEQKMSLMDYLMKIEADPMKSESLQNVEKSIKTELNEKNNAGSATVELTSVEMVEETNPFDELKKKRLELEGVLGSSSVETKWQVVGVTKSEINIEDLTTVLKEQIEKLSEFRIENRQKVSLLIKEQGEEVRITVEKQDNVIKIGASVSENMKDRVDDVLLEIRNEMRDKGIDIEIEVELNEEELEEEQNEQEQNEDKHSKNNRFEGDNNAGNFGDEHND